MKLLYFIAITEFIHVLAHVSVLFGLRNVRKNEIFKKIYFSADLMGALIAYWFLGTPTLLVGIHFFIHLGAVFYLFGWENQTYNKIFELAEQKWNKHSN